MQFISWSGRECYWSNFFLEVAKKCMHVGNKIIQMMGGMCGDCLLGYMFAKVLCSFCTEIDIPTLVYLVPS